MEGGPLLNNPRLSAGPSLHPERPTFMGACISSGKLEIPEKDYGLRKEDEEESSKEVRPGPVMKEPVAERSLRALAQTEPAEASQGASQLHPNPFDRPTSTYLRSSSSVPETLGNPLSSSRCTFSTAARSHQ